MSLLVHARWLDATGNLYPDTCDIQSPANTNDHGDVIEAPWTDIVGLTDLPCRVSPTGGGREARTAPMTYSVVTHYITVAGRYETILPHYRAVVDSVNYDIEAITYDGDGIMTRLATRILTA